MPFTRATRTSRSRPLRVRNEHRDRTIGAFGADLGSFAVVAIPRGCFIAQGRRNNLRADEAFSRLGEKGLKQVPVINTAMKLPRRESLRLAALAVAFQPFRACLRATYPARPVRIFVGFAAGGGARHRSGA